MTVATCLLPRQIVIYVSEVGAVLISFPGKSPRLGRVFFSASVSLPLTSQRCCGSTRDGSDGWRQS